MTARIVNRAASHLLESGRESAVEAPASRPVGLPAFRAAAIGNLRPLPNPGLDRAFV